MRLTQRDQIRVKSRGSGSGNPFRGLVSCGEPATLPPRPRVRRGPLPRAHDRRRSQDVPRHQQGRQRQGHPQERQVQGQGWQRQVQRAWPATTRPGAATATTALQGGPGADQLYGENDNDKLDGGGGNDRVLDGGPGNDTINGNAGNDGVIGGDGNDTINSGSGDDGVDAGPGDDLKVMLGAGNDVGHGGDGNDGDVAQRGIGIQGQDGNDIIYGDAGNDHVSGGAGNDQVYGGDGNDTVDGGDGNDYIDLGAGDDNATGDEGNDTILPGRRRRHRVRRAGLQPHHPDQRRRQGPDLLPQRADQQRRRLRHLRRRLVGLQLPGPQPEHRPPRGLRQGGGRENHEAGPGSRRCPAWPGDFRPCCACPRRRASERSVARVPGGRPSRRPGGRSRPRRTAACPRASAPPWRRGRSSTSTASSCSR